MENVNNTHIIIKNLDLKDCGSGDMLYADFVVIRGIKQGINEWSHLRREYQKAVQLGEIGCDSSCLTCTGPTINDCIICTNYLTEYLVDGKCETSCPLSKPTVMNRNIIFNSLTYEIKTCTLDCGEGYFVNTERNE